MDIWDESRANEANNEVHQAEHLTLWQPSPISPDSSYYEASLIQLGAISFPLQSPHNLHFLPNQFLKATTKILPMCSSVSAQCNNHVARL